MRWHSRARPWLLSIVLLTVAACGQTAKPAAQTPPSGQAAAAGQSSKPRGSIVVAIAWEPDQLTAKSTGGESGLEAKWLFNSPLTAFDEQGGLHAMMAENIPSQDDGSWVVNPDGTMVTTYTLRPNTLWHDGTPITAGDFVFAFQAYTDPSLPYRADTEKHMSAVEAPDDRTVKITWAEPYAFANQLGMQDLGPLPRHKLEQKYQTDRANFTNGDEWTTGYIGSGPFRLDHWDAGQRIVAKAFDDWFMGPPKIETVEVRFIGDSSTALANLLAGELDITTSPPLRVTEAVLARDQWAAGGTGYLKTWLSRIRYLEFQYRDVPGWQRVVTDPQVRKALMYAIDRPSLSSVMTSGFGQVADGWVLPADPMFADVEAAVEKVPFDPQRASAILSDAGWKRQAGGSLTNAAGQTLDIDINSGSAEPQVPTIIADSWKAVGVNAGLDMVPTAQLADPRARASYTGVRVGQRGPTIDGFHLVSAKMPQSPRFNEANYGSFSDPEVDRLWTIADTSLNEAERRQAAIDMNKRLSEVTGYIPLYYQADLLVAKSSLKGPVGPGLMSSSFTWNIYQWETTDQAR